jgi:hypothetical protein
MHENKSEIARLRERWALEEQTAAHSGLAITARHDFIIARAQRGAEHILRLIEEGKENEALALMNTPDWGQGAETQRQRKKKSGKQKKRS